MDIVCTECSVKLTIDENKVPYNKVFALNCPKCKNKITVDTRNNKKSELQFLKEEAFQGQQTAADVHSFGDTSFNIMEESERLALILAKEGRLSERIKNTLESFGYHPVQSFETKDALEKMRFHHFNIVILSNDFDGLSSPLFLNSPIVMYINQLSMSIRRRIFLTLIGEDLKTMDEMQAFSLSANLVVNSNDIKNLSFIMKKALKEHEKFYKVFMDTLAELGKA
jgi:hypothetical protein